MRKTLSVACLALCLPLALMGMPGRIDAANSAPTEFSAPPPPPVVVVATFLDFSSAQTEQFQALLGPFLDTLKALEEQKQAREQVLQQLLNAPAADPAAVGVVVLQIHVMERQQAQAIQAFHQAFMSLLTSDQLQKVQAVSQASQIVPVVGAFQALFLVPPASSAPAAQTQR